MEKSSPILTTQILKHVAEDKAYSWSIYHGQIRMKVEYKRI